MQKFNKLFVWFLTLCLVVTQLYLVNPVVAQSPSSGTDRISGEDRYKTAVTISQKGWKKADYAVVARGDNFADALCAGPLAYKYDGPILLTQPNNLNADTLAELKRLGVKHLFIAGGLGAVSQSVEDEIKAAGITDIERLYGKDRYETSVKIAEKIGDNNKAVLATGDDFPDALSISVIASKLQMPILLTPKNDLPDSIENYFSINTLSTTYIAGGTGVIGPEVERQVPGPIRLSGSDRYKTNVAILKHFNENFTFENIYIATGNQFADALTGAVLAAKKNSPLILVNQDLPVDTAEYLKKKVTIATKPIGIGGQTTTPSLIMTKILFFKENINVSEKYDNAGTYGPETGNTIIQGNVIISAADVTLRNTIIEGDLLLGQSIGDGNVYLKDVTVKGQTVINGGGPNSIIMYNFNGQKVVISVPDGSNVRLVAQGTTSIDDVSIQSNGSLEESDLTGNGFVNVEIPEGAEVTLTGSFNEVSVNASGANVTVAGGSISIMNIEETATGTGVNLSNGTEIETLNANAASNITGQGKITTANVNSNNVTIEQKPTNTTVANGVTSNVDGEQLTGTTTPPPTNGGGSSSSSGSGSGGGDTVAPTVQKPTTNTLTNTTGVVTLTANESGTAYWAVYASSATAPDAAAIEAGTNAVANGTSAYTTADTAQDFNLSGLSKNTAYKVYVIVKDASNNVSGVEGSDAFTTLNTDDTAPILDSIAVKSSGVNANVVTLSFSEAVWFEDLAEGTDIRATVGGNVRNISDTSTRAKQSALGTLDITLDGAALVYGNVIAVTITTSGAAKIKDASVSENTMVATEVSRSVTYAAPLEVSIITGSTSTTGFVVGLNPALSNLQASDFTLREGSSNEVPITGAVTYNNGLTYVINATLTAGKSYTITAVKSGYNFGTRQISFAPIDGGALSGYALRSDGTVWAWGYNGQGQLGNGSKTSSSVRVQVSNLSNVVAIAGGDHSGYALKSDGTVWSWGRNSDGQLGNGTKTNSAVPVQVSNLSGIVSIVAGYNFAYALKSDGTVWAWGGNTDGQLGLTSSTTVPKQVPNLIGIVSMAAGDKCGYALKSDGTVWGWGKISSASSESDPVQILNQVTAISGGNSSGYALKSDGTVWAWGYNEYGQLGLDTTTDSAIPQQVSNLNNVVTIAGGYNFTYALKSDGTVWAWGRNENGQLGNNSISNSSGPVQVHNLSGITAIVGCKSSGYALKSDGTVWAWGYNIYGQLGDSTVIDAYVPVQVARLNLISENVYITYDGNGNTGGDEPTDNNAYPITDTVTVLGNTGNLIKAGYTFAGWNTAVDGSGTLYAPETTLQIQEYLTLYAKWESTTIVSEVLTAGSASITGFVVGLNPVLPNLLDSDFTLRDGANNQVPITKATTYNNGSTYVINATLTAGTSYTITAAKDNYEFGTAQVSAVPISSGYNTSYALKQDGTVMVWGSIYALENTSISPIPVQMSDLNNVTAIAAGGNSGYALKADGTIQAWGFNEWGQLGNNTKTNSTIPVQVSNLSGIMAIAGGYSSGYALKSDGTVWGWGDNRFGQLGNNSQIDSAAPVQVSNLSGIVAIAGGSSSGYALKSDGTVWAWGNNYNGELGIRNNTTLVSSVPRQVSGLREIIMIAAGNRFAYALESDGTVWGWGLNNYGQLGNNSTADRFGPVQVDLNGVVAIAAGGSSGYALRSDGTVRAWGKNDNGQLGNSTTTDSLIPVEVSNLSGVVSVTSGNSTTYALKSSGTVWAWGNSNNGLLGNNSMTDSSVPVEVSL